MLMCILAEFRECHICHRALNTPLKFLLVACGRPPEHQIGHKDRRCTHPSLASAECERSISGLRFQKTYLHSSMRDHMRDGRLSLYCNSSIEILIAMYVEAFVVCRRVRRTCIIHDGFNYGTRSTLI